MPRRITEKAGRCAGFFVRGIVVVWLAVFANSVAAGVETELLHTRHGTCTVRITHDATPDALTATLVIRSYRSVGGVHMPCPPTAQSVTGSLNEALKDFTQLALKPIESLFLGRLIRYPWAVSSLKQQSTLPAAAKMTRAQLERHIANSVIAQPFQQALAAHSYAVSGVSCEKILRDKSGAPFDALCWLHIEHQPDN